MSKNNKKRVLILGGSSDIGQEVVKYFYKKNWLVTAHYSGKNIKFLKKFKNFKVKFIKCDLMKAKNLSPFLKNRFDTVFNLFLIFVSINFFFTPIVIMILIFFLPISHHELCPQQLIACSFLNLLILLPIL